MIDRDLVWQRVGGKARLLQKIIQQFLDFYPGQLRVIREAVQSQDEETLHRASHRLRGAAANFEATEVVRSAGELESSGRAGDWESAQVHLQALTDGMQEVHQELVALAAEVADQVV
jgi:HPt (histidine-containing phosphotransfer) domain-containing protein